MTRALARAALTVLTLASPAAADDYSDSPARKLFDTAPCNQVLGALDAERPTAEGTPQDLPGFAWQSLAWGYILGYDAAKGGLWRGADSPLARFTAECNAAPSKTGAEILRGL